MVTDQQHKTDINSGSFIRWSVSRNVTRSHIIIHCDQGKMGKKCGHTKEAESAIYVVTSIMFQLQK